VVYKKLEELDYQKLREYVKGRYRRKPVPYSWSKEPGIARNTLYDIIRREKPKSILDIGCGQGQDSIPIAKMGVRYVGIDPNPVNVQNARKKNPDGDFRLGFMQELQFPDESFDWSYSISVWEGLPTCGDMVIGIKEALRVTKYRFYNIDFGGAIRCLIERYMAIPSWYGVKIWRASYHAEETKAIVIWEVEKREKPTKSVRM